MRKRPFSEMMIRLLGALWWWVLPVRRRLAVENYGRAFPDRPPGELRRTLGEVAWSYFELMAGRRGTVIDWEMLRGGGIILGGHTGSWDTALIDLARRVPVTIFVKTPSSPLAAAIIDRIRRQGDLELLPPTGSMRAAYEALERGRVVMFVQDQRHNAGLSVPFFDRPAQTSAGFAAMAWRSRPRLFGSFQHRNADGVWEMTIEALDWEIPEDREDALQTLTEATQRYYETSVRRRPWSWWWLHNRWKQV